MADRRDMTGDWTTWQQVTTVADGTSVGYIDVGDGPVALFVHGVFLSSYLWRHVIDQVRTDRRCIAVDLAGHGATVAAGDMSFTMTSQAEMIIGLLDQLAIDTVDLVGNDTGGGVCQVIAANHPDRLRSLVLTNSDVHDNWPPEALESVVEMARLGAVADVASLMAADHDLARSADGLGVGYQHPELLAPDAIEAFTRPLITDVRRARLIEHFLLNADVSELTSLRVRLEALDVPTAVIWGDEDIFFGPEWATWLGDVVPGCQAVTLLAGAKLFFPDDRASDLVPLLRAHWASSNGG